MTNFRTHANPFEKSLSSLFDNFFTELPANLKGEAYQHGFKGFAPVNITEKENSYAIDVIAPGFVKENFKISVEHNILNIEALLNTETQSKGENDKVIKQQYVAKNFKRSFTIDSKIDTDNIEAEYVNGILKITLHKKEIAKFASKEIMIK